MVGRVLTFVEVYLLVLFVIGKGLIMPTFEDYYYFFLLNEVQMSKFMYAIEYMLVAKCVEVTGVLIYRAWFRQVQTRNMVFFGLCGVTVGALL